MRSNARGFSGTNVVHPVPSVNVDIFALEILVAGHDTNEHTIRARLLDVGVWEIPEHTLFGPGQRPRGDTHVGNLVGTISNLDRLESLNFGVLWWEFHASGKFPGGSDLAIWI